ncbi:hypothetical protein [Saccharopolyspora spinosa]|nr:hypothetical protein [Saccharopolyspora spinosa]
MLALISGAERMNSWGLTEQAAGVISDGMQRLPNFYRNLGDRSGIVVAD